jgi:hypothetical protein
MLKIELPICEKNIYCPNHCWITIIKYTTKGVLCILVPHPLKFWKIQIWNCLTSFSKINKHSTKKYLTSMVGTICKKGRIIKSNTPGECHKKEHTTHQHHMNDKWHLSLHLMYKSPTLNKPEMWHKISVFCLNKVG